MSIRSITFDPARLQASGTLFPDEIAADLWIAFHGTSSAASAGIETMGWASHRPSVTKTEVEAIDRIYAAMNWAGSDSGGLAVLRPFSLQHDFAGDESPTYFAEYDFRTLTFARPDFAGGEKVRAVRRSIADLERFLADADLQTSHTGRSGTPVDLAWLRAQVDLLQPLRVACERTARGFAHGVVYAVRFEPADLSRVEFHTTMGIKVIGRVRPQQIVAKVEVPADFDAGFGGEVVQDRMFRARQEPGGLVRTLLARQ